MTKIAKYIYQKLDWIVAEHRIKILYACESGSRAWGFPSPNSDYDVRFIYAHELDWHLSLRDKKDTIDFPINDELDIGGWEIKKVLRLLAKSNAPLLEWIHSPIVYKSEGRFLAEIRKMSPSYFSPVATMHHYLSMSKKYQEACSRDEIKLKNYFYALRTTIAGAWIREKGTMPPVEISKMFDVVDGLTEEKIKELIDLKAGQNESYMHPNEPVISRFIASEIHENERIAASLPASRGNLAQLDEFYKRVVKGEI